mmetsp:Transcript_9460/g.28472  ORF Transcript_9460/g.28472 Transcript_9460/m.28472 type:complete len:211 (+) Transcript_9460:1765-2397(+)
MTRAHSPSLMVHDHQGKYSLQLPEDRPAGMPPGSLHVLGVQKEIHGQVLVLVAGEKGLDALLPAEPHGLQPLDGGRLLLRHLDSTHPSIVIVDVHASLPQSTGQHLGEGRVRLPTLRIRKRLVHHLQELFLVIVDECQQLWVLSTQLLKHGLQDGGVPLHHLPQPLELWVVAQKGQRRTTAPTAAAPLLEHIKRLCVGAGAGGCGRCGCG